MVSTIVKWMWNGSADPWSKLSTIQWIPYTPTESEQIEQGYLNQLSKIELQNYEIDFINNIQIHKINRNCQRQILRDILREDRFLRDPLVPKIAVQATYISCYSLFILECQRQKIVTIKQLKNETTRPFVVELAAEGIVDEGYIAGEVTKAKAMASELFKNKFNSLDDIYACAIRLYTYHSFLYKTINSTLRLAEDNLSIEQQYSWTCKLQTLGPFAIILEHALSHYATRTPMIAYRSSILSNEQIEQFQKMDFLECGYFSGFTSCSRSLQQAERFNGNVLFTIELPKRHFAISARQGLTDIKRFSIYPREEEILMRPATLFHVNSVQWDLQNKRYDIHLTIL